MFSRRDSGPLMWFLSFTDFNARSISLEPLKLSYFLMDSTDNIRPLPSGLERNMQQKEYFSFPLFRSLWCCNTIPSNLWSTFLYHVMMTLVCDWPVFPQVVTSLHINLLFIYTPSHTQFFYRFTHSLEISRRSYFFLPSISTTHF